MDQVLRDVPKAQRCQCRAGGAKAPAAKPAAKESATAGQSWLGRLLGR